VAGLAALWARLLVSPETQEYMVAWWGERGAFAPPFTDYPTWVLDQWRVTVLSGFLFNPYIGGGAADVIESAVLSLLEAGVWVNGAIFIVALFGSALAIVTLAGIGWSGAVVLPFVFAWALSRLQVYPIDARTSVFLVPFVLLLVGFVVTFIARSFPRSKRPLVWALQLSFLLLFVAILMDRPPVYALTHDREVFLELSRRRSPDEPVFMHSNTTRGIPYYGVRFGVTEGISYGVDLPTDLATLFGFRGEPSLWVVFSNAQSRDFLLCYLDEIGRETERLVFRGDLANRPTSLHRYDLSDDTRWISPAASDFPLTEAAFEGSSPRCRRQP
jgi:hypothetical protein